ncbi:MAG: aminotransferase class V-fold PLP-dependent enzyme [Planctomycetes bacterium]|nr:aminotransferase class V-fold PLP-dependent enzyme [Planctomycetota bacterium]
MKSGDGSDQMLADPADIWQECAGNGSGVNLQNVREHIVGLEREAPLLDGRKARYVNLDNAATTPSFKPVLAALSRFLQWYGSIHRSGGFKSLLSTHIYERCRREVADFIGADLSYHTVIFVQNATHALNKLAMRICMPQGHMVLTTVMEHHSNMLPWRKLGCTVEYVGVRPDDGALDLNDMKDKICRNEGRLCLVTVSGGSNVTGVIPPIRRIARLAHAHGAMIAVDATQLVAHRKFKMGASDDPERVDFAAFSAHKMYAPFGSGVLVGPRWVFERGTPDIVGGGTVSGVTIDEVAWADPPEREEAGTPNLPGALALATAIRTLESIGMDNLAEHERELTRRALAKLTRMEGLTLFGPKDPSLGQDRLGVIALNAGGLSHAKLAAILGYEWGIGARNGCFCAHPYVRELLGISMEEMQAVIRKLASGDHATTPGMVRASLGVYNSAEEVDYFVEALQRIVRFGPRAEYVLDANRKGYIPLLSPSTSAATPGAVS